MSPGVSPHDGFCRGDAVPRSPRGIATQNPPFAGRRGGGVSGWGLWLVQRFQLVSVLKEPIAPYLTGGKLVVTSPTEPVMIVLKLGLLVGLVLASPIILWQTWAFLAPALYQREKRALVPSLFVGLVLFLTGGGLAYRFVVPQALRVLFSFQSEAIAPFITYDAYFSFVLQVTLALGLSFELPLVIIILSWLGVIGPAELNRFRRYAIVLAFVAGAVLSPGTDVLSMTMMTLPLILLYEVGFAGSAILQRRRRKAERESLAGKTAGVILLLALLGARAGSAGAGPAAPPADGASRIPPWLTRPGHGEDKRWTRRSARRTGPADRRPPAALQARTR